VNSIQLAHDKADGKQPTILFLHGLGADRLCFQGALDSKELKGRAMLIPDLVGYGDSPKPASFSYTMQAQAEEVMALCKSLDVHELAIVAHSMGGAIGILIAEQWPNLVTHFANLVGNLVPQDCFFSRKFIQAGYEDFSDQGFDKFKQRIQNAKIKPGRPISTYADALEKTTAEVIYKSSQDLVQISDHQNLLARFLALDCRKIYFQDQDNPMDPELKQGLTKANIPIECIPDTGHSLMEDNPTVFYPELSDFL
jgi:pimeloyl-ACP methyl ester carboxylesterase